MLTISKLARRCGLSRSTLLYYESIGLLKPAPRTAARYRAYGEKDARRLEQICVYRAAGLTLEDIRAILDRPENDAGSILKRRLAELSVEIERLRSHQRAILRLLNVENSVWRMQMVTKEKLVSIMKASGLTEEDMRKFHAEFERSAPEEHQEFLEFLKIPKEEIRTIREASRKG
ncbi:MAG: MerR family transcriptional regulator [Acidobacteriota bacterium]